MRARRIRSHVVAELLAILLLLGSGVLPVLAQDPGAGDSVLPLGMG